VNFHCNIFRRPEAAVCAPASAIQGTSSLPSGWRDRAERRRRSHRRAVRLVRRRSLIGRRRLPAVPLRHGTRSRGHAALDRGGRDRDPAGAGDVSGTATYRDGRNDALSVGAGKLW